MASSDPRRPCWMPISVHQAAGLALCLEMFAASRRASQGWAILLWCLPLQSNVFETYHFYDLDNILAKWNRKFKVYCSTVWRFLSKLKIELPHDPKSHYWVYIQIKTWSKRIHAPQHSLKKCTIVRTWKQPKCPSTEEWIKNIWCVYTMKYCPVTRKNEIMPFAATWMDLEIVILSEVKSNREGAVSYDITYIWNLKRNDTNEAIYKAERDSQT